MAPRGLLTKRCQQGDYLGYESIGAAARRVRQAQGEGCGVAAKPRI
jgi:hypothetical protein